MVDDFGAAQARALLSELNSQVENISRKIDIVGRRQRRAASVRGAAHNHRQRSELRCALYEAHRLVDGLHRRYPETLPAQRRGYG